jgi:hypothetical protein
VILDPPIGNLNQLIGIKLNQAVSQALKQLKTNSKDDNMPNKSTFEAYQAAIDLAAEELNDLLGSYYHCKAHFAVL